MTDAPSPRLVNPQPQPEDRLDPALRPKTLDDLIGQERVKENLHILIAAAKRRNEPLDHVLFYGPPGLGKTTLAHVLANEMGVNIKITSGPAIENAGDLAAILTNLRAGDILFIDEVHRLGRAIEEVLYPAMEDYALDIIIGKGPAARSIRLKLPRFTVIGATTRLALVTAPLRARFGAVYRLDFYEQEAMQAIVRRGGAACWVCKPSRRASKRSPAAGAARRAWRCACCAGCATMPRCAATASSPGPSPMRRSTCWMSIRSGWTTWTGVCCATIIEKYRGGPVGLSTIAASISEEPDTIMDVVEPYLLQLGFLERTPQGRVATRLAYEHLKLPIPNDGQTKLF